MKASARSKGNPVSATEVVVFELQNLEITPDALVIHFFEEKTIIPLENVASYRFNWYLHDPIFAKKWWFLMLTVTLKNGDEESGTSRLSSSIISATTPNCETRSKRKSRAR